MGVKELNHKARILILHTPLYITFDIDRDNLFNYQSILG